MPEARISPKLIFMGGLWRAYPMIPPIAHQGKPLQLGPSQRRHTRRAVRPWMRFRSARYFSPARVPKAHRRRPPRAAKCTLV